MKKRYRYCISIYLFTLLCTGLFAQPDDSSKYWHRIPRIISYHPEGSDIVITNGNRRFTRALYGTNTAFRVEAGDLPEFAMYLPGMGGNLKFGLISGDSSKWLIHSKNIVARYRPGSMLYDITDPMLGGGILHLQVLAMGDAEGIILKITPENVISPVSLIWAFGGVSGRKFSRDGDLNVDPESSFYLKPENCVTNQIIINPTGFQLQYGTVTSAAEVNRYEGQALPADSAAINKARAQTLVGFTPASGMHIGDAKSQNSPKELFGSTASSTPLVCGNISLKGSAPVYFAIKKSEGGLAITYESLPLLFQRAEIQRQQLANRIKIQTPDPYINTLGGVIGIAADAIWDSPTFMHGAIGWRMRLNGWRGPYTADVLGWHDRARLHFRSYAQSQLTSPASGPVVMDTALHLARSLEKLGTSVYSSGYISRNPGGDFRPHHYDMNLVYIDQLLRHFNWTGDTAFVKEMWPVIQRHLAWEKRNFDPDGDGLYDAYAAIWASDALQYSGGGVTHTSAYNYFANKQAAMLAGLIGENGNPYQQEAAKILNAINTTLWMKERGSYAEYKDAEGEKLLHPYAGLWTYYHAIDSEVPNPFQAYQTTKWIDWNIPHIPVRAKGLPDSFYTLSTTNWMPYDWSLNNVATAEVMHTALAKWQAGRAEDAFQLWKSELLSTMYLGGSAGNIGQISFYDAARGEAYRDFGDPVGMTSRSLIEGLFGILPDALHNQLVIRPGFPAAWKNAAIQTPDIAFSYKMVGNGETYVITPAFQKMLALRLQLKVRKDKIVSILVNGKKAVWKNRDSAIGSPEIDLICPKAKSYTVKIIWGGNEIDKPQDGDYYELITKDLSVLKEVLPPKVTPLKVYEPEPKWNNRYNNGMLSAEEFIPDHNRTAFLQVKQGDFKWWAPLDKIATNPVQITPASYQPRNQLSFQIKSNHVVQIVGYVSVTETFNISSKRFYVGVGQNSKSQQIFTPNENIVPGTNEVFIKWRDDSIEPVISKATITSWNIDAPAAAHFETINLFPYFNDKVTQIFKNKYLSPRPKTATLQLPTQGIGDWTHPLKTANINDSGLRVLAGAKNEIRLPQGIPFATPSDTLLPNIAFTSQWDNYPKQITIPLTGSASHAYLLMAGSTNPMQSRMTNGLVIFHYTDGSSDSLLLKNPQNWWPIEQDYMDDGYAFQINAARPVRVHLKTGKMVSDYDNSIAAYAGKMIDGGAATVLDLPLNINKTLKSLVLQTRANDVVIGLMSLTLMK